MFVWRLGTVDEAEPPYQSFTSVLVPRIIISLVFVLGLVYFVLVAVTFTKYGQQMEDAWAMRVAAWVESCTVGKGNPPPLTEMQYPKYPTTATPDDQQEQMEVYPRLPRQPGVYPGNKGSSRVPTSSRHRSGPTMIVVGELPARSSSPYPSHPFLEPGPPLPRLRKQERAGRSASWSSWR